MRRGEMRVWTKGFCVGIYNKGGLNATRLAMEEEDRRKVGTKSRPNRRRPRKAGVKFILVCPALPNFFSSNVVEKRSRQTAKTKKILRYVR